MRLNEGVKLVWNGLLDVIYPPRCLVCGAETEEPFCAVCRSAVMPLCGPFCDRCGVPISPGRLVCTACEAGPEPPFGWSQAVGQYTGILRTAIHRLKYDRKGALGDPLGELLAEAMTRPSPLMPEGQRFDCVVPVPLHSSRLRERGFNQSERIARVLASRYGAPLDCRGLVRTRPTRSQTAFQAAGRHANVDGAFDTLSPMYFDGKSVLLIDDVLTTMSTVTECSRVLRNAGAKRVAVLALARGL